jgi:hypothetical protein
MLPLYYVKFMFLDESCTLLGRVEAEQGKKLFIKWHRQRHVLDSDLDVINKRFHGIFRIKDLGRVGAFWTALLLNGGMRWAGGSAVSWPKRAQCPRRF